MSLPELTFRKEAASRPSRQRRASHDLVPVWAESHLTEAHFASDLFHLGNFQKLLQELPLSFQEDRLQSMRSIFPAITLLGLMISLLQAAPVTLKSADGKSITCELISLEGEVIEFTNSANRKKYKLPLERLDEASKKIVLDWSKSPASKSSRMKIQTNIVRGNKKSQMENYDDRQVTVTPKVTVENGDSQKGSAPAEVVTVTFATPVNTPNTYYVITSQKVAVPALEPLSDHPVTFASGSIIYDNKKYAKHGNRYYGYVTLLLVDGEVIASESHPRGAFSEVSSAILMKLQAGRQYQKNFSDVQIGQ